MDGPKAIIAFSTLPLCKSYNICFVNVSYSCARSAPETYDVVDSVIEPLQRKNLGEVSKMLNQISVGRLFSDDYPYLQPLNQYVTDASARFSRWVSAGSNLSFLAGSVTCAHETHFSSHRCRRRRDRVQRRRISRPHAAETRDLHLAERVRRVH
jgi:hypothetical protein